MVFIQAPIFLSVSNLCLQHILHIRIVIMTIVNEDQQYPTLYRYTHIDTLHTTQNILQNHHLIFLGSIASHLSSKHPPCVTQLTHHLAFYPLILNPIQNNEFDYTPHNSLLFLRYHRCDYFYINHWPCHTPLISTMNPPILWFYSQRKSKSFCSNCVILVSQFTSVHISQFILQDSFVLVNSHRHQHHLFWEPSFSPFDEYPSQPCQHSMVHLGWSRERHNFSLNPQATPWAQLQRNSIILRDSSISLMYNHCSSFLILFS